MKSLVQEASSVIKALEKAWLEAGKPHDFTVRVFEEEKKSFFGFSKKNAIVSIVYEEEVHKKAPSRSSHQPAQQRRQVRQPSPVKRPYEAEPARAPRRFQEPQEIKQHKHVAEKVAEVEAKEAQYEVLTTWTQELVQDIRAWLGELTDVMAIKTKFEVKVERQLLKVEFERPILEVVSEERMLFSSFAYILMQFMKRKYKKKLRGCRLAISSRR
jgi:predicted RNA-binding protein Jag